MFFCVFLTFHYYFIFELHALFAYVRWCTYYLPETFEIRHLTVLWRIIFNHVFGYASNQFILPIDQLCFSMLTIAILLTLLNGRFHGAMVRAELRNFPRRWFKSRSHLYLFVGKDPRKPPIGYIVYMWSVSKLNNSNNHLNLLVWCWWYFYTYFVFGIYSKYTSLFRTFGLRHKPKCIHKDWVRHIQRVPHTICYPQAIVRAV